MKTVQLCFRDKLLDFNNCLLQTSVADNREYDSLHKNTKRRNIVSTSDMCCIHVNLPDIYVQTFIYMIFKQTICRTGLPYTRTSLKKLCRVRRENHKQCDTGKLETRFRLLIFNAFSLCRTFQSIVGILDYLVLLKRARGSTFLCVPEIQWVSIVHSFMLF